MILKQIYIFLGGLFLVIGVIGAFLPLLPTTPFLLLAGFFFSKGSDKFHQWLLNHKHFGPPIHDWNEHGIIRLKHKILATSMLIISASFMLPRETIPMVGKASFSVLAIILLTFIWSRPSH